MAPGTYLPIQTQGPDRDKQYIARRRNWLKFRLTGFRANVQGYVNVGEVTEEEKLMFQELDDKFQEIFDNYRANSVKLIKQYPTKKELAIKQSPMIGEDLDLDDIAF